MIATVFAIGCAKAPSLQPQMVFDFSDADFGGFSAAATLEAIGSICQSADSSVTVEFVIDNESKTFVFSTGEIFSGRGISIDPPHFNVSGDRISHDGEAVSIEEAAHRIKRYAEATRLTDSRPVLRLSASSGSKNSDLAVLLDLIAAEGILHLLTEPGGKTA